MATKKIKLETLGQTAKKKKDFLIVISVFGILTFLFISIGMAFLETDQKKVFKEREEQKLNDKEVSLVPEKDFKENWAISVENTLEKQNQKLDAFMKQQQEEAEKSKEEFKNMIIDSSADQKAMIEQNNEDRKNALEGLKSYVEDKLLKQENRLEEIAVAKNNSTMQLNFNGESSSANNDDTIEIGNDLLPPQPKREKNVSKPRKIVEDTINAIIGNNEEDKKPSSKSDPEVTDNEALIPKSSASSKSRITLQDINTEKNREIIQKNKEITESQKEEAENNSYHIMTGLSRAYMITGAYAPAFSSGEEEPLPVLLQAEGDILIANDDTASVDKCLLIGSARGNMNSKTADIRLVKISCSLNDGKNMVEGSINGWVIGENGIPGVPGELLHKNGAWLSQTFVAGFLQTFSDALSNTGTTQISLGGTTTSTGTSTTVPVGTAVTDNMKSSVGGGLSTVFGKLGDYYIKMAEQIFPVIEVKAGRTVNILLKGGETLTVQDFNKMHISTIQDRLERKATLKTTLKKVDDSKKIEYTTPKQVEKSALTITEKGGEK